MSANWRENCSIYSSYFVRDTCISVAHVSNRLRFDTFFLLSYFLLKMVSVMSELYSQKKSPISQMFYGIVGVLKGVAKNFANFTGKHLCRVKSERKILTLSMKPAPS